jgi:spore coat protein H
MRNHALIRIAAKFWLWVTIGWLLAGKAEAATTRETDLFLDSPLRTIQIEVSPEGMEILRQSSRKGRVGMHEQTHAEATVRENGQVYTKVAIHLKGSFGSFRPVDSKPGLTLKFDKTAKHQLFHGLSKISLNNSVQDSSYISDKLCRELYAQAGVPVPRVDYAVVELNGQKLGLYLLVEGWDKRFLKRYFNNVDGNLYDPPQLFDIDKPLEVITGVHPDDQSELAELAQACAGKDPDQRLEQIRKLVDFDRLLTLLAFDVMIWNWDGYPLFQNNYRVFHNVESHRIVFMPHGMDQMFWKPDGPILTGRNGLVARGVLQAEAGRRLYLDRFRELRASVYDVQAITNRVNVLAARIRPALLKAGFLSGIQHSRAVNRLNRLIAQRAVEMDRQLASLQEWQKIGVGETVTLSGWEPVETSGELVLDQAPDAGPLHIQAKTDAIGVWRKVLWLEEGTYVLQGRLKTAGVVSPRRDSLKGAGLRVFSLRKQSNGLRWSWFPYDESRDYEHRGEMGTAKNGGTRLTGTTDWTDVSYEFQLRQPLADLQIQCELYAKVGEAWFDPQSLKLTRKTAVCP